MNEPTRDTSQYIDNYEYDEVLNAKRVTDVGSDSRTEVDDYSESDVVYVGVVARGIQDNEGGWVISKIDTSTPGVHVTHAIDSWDNRASANYS